MRIEDILTDRSNKRSMNTEQIQSVIPHRETMLFLDSIVDYEPGEWAIGHKTAVSEDYYFSGHFPGMPLMPGSLQIEALSQVCVFIMLIRANTEFNAGILAEVKNARFFEPVHPSSEIKLYAVKQSDRMGIWKFTGLIKCNEITCMTADMTLTLTKI